LLFIEGIGDVALSNQFSYTGSFHREIVMVVAIFDVLPNHPLVLSENGSIVKSKNGGRFLL
jgi:hypothetical protein